VAIISFFIFQDYLYRDPTGVEDASSMFFIGFWARRRSFRPDDGSACPFQFDGSGVGLADGILCALSLQVSEQTVILL
jgi:hypothetical protein